MPLNVIGNMILGIDDKKVNSFREKKSLFSYVGKYIIQRFPSRFMGCSVSVAVNQLCGSQKPGFLFGPKYCNCSHPGNHGSPSSSFSASFYKDNNLFIDIVRISRNIHVIRQKKVSVFFSCGNLFFGQEGNTWYAGTKFPLYKVWWLREASKIGQTLIPLCQISRLKQQGRILFDPAIVAAIGHRFIAHTKRKC